MTVAATLKKATFKHIESEIYGYRETLKEIEILRKDIMFCSTNDDENVGGGRRSLPSSPTERIGVRLATHRKLTRLEEVVLAIETVYEGLPADHKELVRLKYWTRPQTLTWEGIADQLHVSRATAIRWRDSIVMAISEVLGWR